MKRLSVIAVIALVSASLLACSPKTDQLLLTQERMGQVVFGASLESVEGVLGEDVSNQIKDPACSMVSFKAYPGTLFMVEEGIVTRADAAPDVPNVLRIKVGESREAVLGRYPKAHVGPHKYLEGGYYLTFPSKDGKAAIILEVGDDKVLEIRAGLQPSVSYVERCS
jgi:hypothetical protein